MSDNSDKHVSNSSKITEDGPVMRSVAIMSPATMSHLESFQQLSLQSDHKPLVHQKSSYVKPVIVFSDKVAPSVEDTPWRVVKALPFPANYVLDRSHTRISNSSPLVVSKRITDYLFRQSISATFDNEKALAVGTTATCLKFHIRIWDVADAIVVEVQRYAGCCFEFQGTVSDVLSVAKSGQARTTGSRFGSLPIPRSLPKLPDNVWKESTDEALDIAFESLKNSNRIDSQSLAIESLEQLSSSENCRTFCAKAILSAESELLPIIVALIHKTEFSARHASEESAGGLDDCYRLMRREAVNTVANCLESMQTSRPSEFDIKCLVPLSTAMTLSALVHDIAGAERCPHDAASSCRCLHLLCHLNDSVKQAVMELGVTVLAANASKCRHTMLQKESLRLLQIL